jgi:hypothetical protein
MFTCLTSVLTYLFSFYPLKISDGAAEDIRSLVKERYTILSKVAAKSLSDFIMVLISLVPF